MGDRLDRIEKGIEALFKGIDKLRESQTRTDEQIKEVRESQAKTDEQIARTHEEIMDLRESQAKTDEQIRELRESQLRTHEEIRELKKFLDEVGRRLDKVGEQLGDLGIVQGEVAEDLFYRNLKSLFKKRDMLFREVKRNVRRKGKGEYDIVASNGKEVLVIEVKNKLTRRLVDEFIRRKLPRFKELFPEYKDKMLLGGVGALVVKEDVGRYAEKAGLFVLTQTDEGGAALVNKDRFRPKVFA